MKLPSILVALIVQLYSTSIIVGAAQIATNYTHAFRYAGGTMSDLNTLLTASGVNMGSIVLVTATGISANGKYIVANDEIASIGAVFATGAPVDSTGHDVRGGRCYGWRRQHFPRGPGRRS